jgi:Uma2 family endonuclease
MVALASRVLRSCPMSAPKRRATYEDLMQVPDHLVAEIIDGELVTSPRPATPHARACSVIGQDLAPFDRQAGGPGGPGGWWVLDEPELHLGGDILVPDLAAWRHERMPAIPNVAFFTLAPDWICEVISPRTGRIDRTRKMMIYAREGVHHLWLVDPLANTIEVYRLDAERWMVAGSHGGDDIVGVEPFGAIPIALARWWLEAPTRETGL